MSTEFVDFDIDFNSVYDQRPEEFSVSDYYNGTVTEAALRTGKVNKGADDALWLDVTVKVKRRNAGPDLHRSFSLMVGKNGQPNNASLSTVKGMFVAAGKLPRNGIKVSTLPETLKGLPVHLFVQVPPKKADGKPDGFAEYRSYTKVEFTARIKDAPPAEEPKPPAREEGSQGGGSGSRGKGGGEGDLPYQDDDIPF